MIHLQKTLMEFSSLKKVVEGKKREQAYKVGEKIAKMAKEKGIWASCV